MRRTRLWRQKERRRELRRGCRRCRRGDLSNASPILIGGGGLRQRCGQAECRSRRQPGYNPQNATHRYSLPKPVNLIVSPLVHEGCSYNNRSAGLSGHAKQNPVVAMTTAECRPNSRHRRFQPYENSAQSRSVVKASLGDKITETVAMGCVGSSGNWNEATPRISTGELQFPPPLVPTLCVGTRGLDAPASLMVPSRVLEVSLPP